MESVDCDAGWVAACCEVEVHTEQPSVHPEGGKTLRVFPSWRGWYGWVGENVEEGVQCGRFGGEMGGG